MDSQPSYRKDEIYNCISKAYKYLYEVLKEEKLNGPRSLSIIGICLTYREHQGSYWIEYIKKRILSLQKDLSKNTASWNEEIWDTSLSLIALKKLGYNENSKPYKKAKNWICSIYNLNGRNNWHDEAWETAWSTHALLRSSDAHETFNISYEAVKWMQGLQDDTGKVVAPHYTGYYIILLGYFFKEHQNKITEEDLLSFKKSSQLAVKYLLKIMDNNILWTGEAWSNGQILWALSFTNQFPLENHDLVRTVAKWFINNQQDDGSLSDPEDTASAIIGLVGLLKGLYSDSFKTREELEIMIFNKFRKDFSSPVFKMKRKFLESHADGGLSINISKTLKTIFTVAFSLVAVVTTIYAFWDMIIKIFEK